MEIKLSVRQASGLQARRTKAMAAQAEHDAYLTAILDGAGADIADQWSMAARDGEVYLCQAPQPTEAAVEN